MWRVASQVSFYANLFQSIFFLNSYLCADTYCAIIYEDKTPSSKSNEESVDLLNRSSRQILLE